MLDNLTILILSAGPRNIYESMLMSFPSPIHKPCQSSPGDKSLPSCKQPLTRSICCNLLSKQNILYIQKRKAIDSDFTILVRSNNNFRQRSFSVRQLQKKLFLQQPALLQRLTRHNSLTSSITSLSQSLEYTM